MAVDLNSLVDMDKERVVQKSKGVKGRSPRYPRVVCPSGRHIAPARIISIFGAYNRPEGLAWAVLKALNVPVQRKGKNGQIIQQGVTTGTFNMRYNVAGHPEYYWPTGQQILSKDKDGKVTVGPNDSCKADCQFILAIGEMVRQGKKLSDLHKELGLVLFIPGEGSNDDG